MRQQREHDPRPRWTVHFSESTRVERARTWATTELGLTEPRAALDVDGLPFLLSPDGRYDADLNSFFTRQSFVMRSRNTWEAAARDLAVLFSFVHLSRDGKPWRSIEEDDLSAYYSWRFLDRDGPRLAGSTWNRQLAIYRSFFRWAARGRHIPVDPTSDLNSRRSTPNKVEWLTPRMYRTWRDVGLRGYTPEGEPDPSVTVRWAARNATAADLFVRTGLRLTELSGWAVEELPDRVPGSRFLRAPLAPALAKGGVGRDVYFPIEVLDAVENYVRWERRAAVDQARDRGTYNGTGWTVLRSSRELRQLSYEERRTALREGPDGLEPVSLWVTERGLPASRSLWREVFRAANARCQAAGLSVRCHPHALRHSFSVITLEQLQRGQVRALAGHTPRQRSTYERIFGDPVRWVQMLLGHASYVTTMRYLHVLREIEFRAKIELTASDPLDTAYLADVHRGGDGAAR
jgi:site-specific recombinase XerD